MLAQDVEAFPGPDLLDERFDGGGVDMLGPFAGETEKDGPVGGVAEAGEREGAEEFGFDAGGAGELIGGGEIDYELAGRAHGSDGVGTGRADADFEEIEDASFHTFWFSQESANGDGQLCPRRSDPDG